MAYYRVCSFCGAHLDPGERCDCQAVKGEVDGNGISRGEIEERQCKDSGEGKRSKEWRG